MFFRPEFFDIFGFVVFGFITGISIWYLQNGGTLPRWVLILLLVIGVAGLIIDGGIVFTAYIN